MSISDYKSELAWKLVKYEKDFDFYEFNDCYESESSAYDEFLKVLGSPKGIKEIIKSIKNDIDYLESFKSNDLKSNIKETSELLKEVINYSKNIKKMEGGMEL